MYFRECPYCGCSLDPGEKCDCREEAEKNLQLIKQNIYLDQKSNQYEIILKQKKSISA